LFIGHKLQVDLGDLHDEREHLATFLNTKLKIEFTPMQNKLVVDSETLSPQELERVVNKFVYHRNLNSTHWVSLEGKVVKINKFQNKDKKEEKKPDKHKKTSGSASNITQNWGL
jgi:hypothetical protein